MTELNKSHMRALLIRRNHLYKLYADGSRLMLEKKLFDQSVAHSAFGYTLTFEKVGMTKRGEIYRVSESVEYFKNDDVDIDKAIDAFVSRATNKDPSVITHLGCEIQDIVEYCLV